MQSGYVHGFQFPDGRSIHLYRGSLAEVRADALVSSDDNHLSAGGGVSAVLAKVAGADVAIERERMARQARPSLGEVVRTLAGGLPCRFLYHAITINFDQGSFQSEDSLRRLVANLLDRATADGVSSLGLPALGTGAAAFPLGRTSEVIIEELVKRMRHSSVRRVVLALLGDEAERHFHENLVRVVALRRAAAELRERDKTRRGTDGDWIGWMGHTVCEGPLMYNVSLPRVRSALSEAVGWLTSKNDRLKNSETAAFRTADIESFDGETVEQLAPRFDERRLRRIDDERPRLVSGLTDILLRQASPEEIEQELLSLPECHGFRGTLRQRLMEFLYLSEEKSRLALGPALFKTRELRILAAKLGLKDVAHLDHDALVSEVLRELGFNMVAPPRGSREAIQRVERLLGALRSTHPDERDLRSAVIEAGRILEGFLLDLLKLYSGLFWGDRADDELVARGLIVKRGKGSSIHHLTLGQLREVMDRLSGMIRRDEDMKQRWSEAGRQGMVIFHRGNDTGAGRNGLDGLSEFIAARNDAAHHRTRGDGPQRKMITDRESTVHAHAEERAWTVGGVTSLLEALLDFCQMCRRNGIYPEVLRYEGTFENRHGERFLHFLDESQLLRKVRSDEVIDPRRHYFCFATNNPVHLFPVLIPKD